MAFLYTDKMISIIKSEYADSDNETLANKLGIPQGTLRWKASQLGVRKSDTFMKDYYLRLQANRKIKQEENYKNYELTNVERNIIIGSLLGDGTLSKYGRSLNACYRENTGSTQVPYRIWKMEKLSNLDFKANSKGAIYSPSHPIYTELYGLFYPNGKKIISKDGLKMLNHPIGLACLFMDDGTLVTSASHGINTITITSSISLYTQSFTKEENIMLLEHIKNTFDVEFRLANIPSGYGYHLILSKNNSIRNFLKIISTFVDEIPSMKYKVDLDSKLMNTKIKYSIKHPDRTVKIANKITVDNSYSKKDELEITEMINNGYNLKLIAKNLDRTYYGLCDKVRRMRIKGEV